MVSVAEVQRGCEVAVGVTIRPARPDDIAAIERLITASATALPGGYTPDQVAAALAHVFGVDTQLIADSTYFVAETQAGLAGCGGWSRRRTLFGGDRCAGRTADLLDPATEPARIRAFFIDPARSRAGIGRALLARCEAEARAAGFGALTLAATLAGVPFYRAAGFVAQQPFNHDAGGTSLPFVQMTKTLEPARTSGRDRES